MLNCNITSLTAGVEPQPSALEIIVSNSTPLSRTGSPLSGDFDRYFIEQVQLNLDASKKRYVNTGTFIKIYTTIISCNIG